MSLEKARVLMEPGKVPPSFFRKRDSIKTWVLDWKIQVVKLSKSRFMVYSYAFVFRSVGSNLSVKGREQTTGKHSCGNSLLSHKEQVKIKWLGYLRNGWAWLGIHQRNVLTRRGPINLYTRSSLGGGAKIWKYSEQQEFPGDCLQCCAGG